MCLPYGGKNMADKSYTLSKEQIQSLPRWAQVAFVARCARRVQPIFSAAWPNAPQEHIIAIEKAISGAEAAAARASSAAFDLIESGLGAGAAALAAGLSSPAYEVGMAAEYALGAAAGPLIESSINVASRVAEAFASATRAAIRTGSGSLWLATGVAIYRDFERLKASAMVKGWTDETCVPPEFFGPLWHRGEEPDWNHLAD
jgi:hypothetical protein